MDLKYHRDLKGLRFGRLVVMKEAPKIKKEKRWECLCDCGNTKIVTGVSLRNGNTVSCGCYQMERIVESHTKHGDSYTRLYHIYQGMKSRCVTPTNEKYKDYGGRGIKVCSEWMNADGYKNFKSWALANGYKENLTIDRIDVNGNYEPTNCRWATSKEQNNNMRSNRFVEYKGERRTLSQWAEITGIPRPTLWNRLNKNKPLEEVFNK